MEPTNSKTDRKKNENVNAADIQMELGQTIETAQTRIKKNKEARDIPRTDIQSLKNLSS